MRKFTRYKKDKIAHFHKDNGLVMIKTIKEFGVTYKELYKIIDQSRIFNFEIINGINNKKCSGCLTYKPYNNDYYYKRKGSTSFYSVCKVCMRQQARTYRIVNSKKLYNKRKEYYKEYHNNNKKKISIKKNQYYLKNRYAILSDKRHTYKQGKIGLLKKFLFKLKRK